MQPAAVILHEGRRRPDMTGTSCSYATVRAPDLDTFEDPVFLSGPVTPSTGLRKVYGLAAGYDTPVPLSTSMPAASWKVINIKSRVDVEVDYHDANGAGDQIELIDRSTGSPLLTHY